MITGNKIRLREKKLADAINDYSWQTDSELTQLDAAQQQTITFSQYLSIYASELRHSTSTRHQFAVETLDGKHIGNCGYYGVDEIKGEAELGIMIGNRDYWGNGHGADAVTALVSYVFRQTNLNRLYLKTLDWNIRAQKCFQKCGFTYYGHMVRDGFNFALMEIHREQWEEHENESSRLEDE